ncbi:MAG: hypothetical protein J5574_06325 [Lachnospiraceae bacterium]|nr:hypothetical protein [Lachnospiraceae bacterium]
MKGRINVLDDGGVILNASAANKIILQGNIIAGDFVEYKTEPIWIDQAQSISFKFSIGDYAIALIGSTLTAFKNGAQLATYAAHNCSILNKCGDFIVFHDNNAGVLGVLGISDNGFSLVSTLSTGVSNVVAIAAGGGEVCAITNSSYESSDYYTKVIYAEISASGVLSGIITSNVRYRLTFACIFLNYASGFYFTYVSGTSLSETTEQQVRSVPILFNESHSASFGDGVSCGGCYAGLRQVYQQGSTIGLAYYYYYAASGSVSHGQTGYLKIMDIITGSYVDKTFPNYGEVFSYIHNGKVLISECIQTGSSGYATFWSANKIKLCQFNDTTYEITEIDSKTFTEYIEKKVQNTRGGIAGNYALVQLYQTATDTHYLDLRAYEIINGSLDDKADRNYVETYTGGAAIGVAKESGAAGDTIAVYIPTPSA